MAESQELSSNPENLKKKKATIKGYFTRLENQIKAAEGKKFTLSELKEKKNKLQSYHKKIDDLRKSFDEVTDPDGMLDIKQDLDEIFVRYEKLEVSLSLLISQSSPDVKPKTEESKPSIRLPEIPLPIFSGYYEDWSNFKILFEYLISKNPNLSDSQKLSYLRAALKGDAKNIQSIDDTYESLFTALQQHFENKRLPIHTHVLSILNHDHLQDSSKSLRVFIDCLKRNLGALSVLNYERNKLADVLLINIILQKLDKESRKQFELTPSSNQSPELDDLITFLEKRSSILESTQVARGYKMISKRHSI